jgi:hypothetical protein
MFWIVAIIGFIAALGWLLAARARASGSPVWSVLQEAATGSLRLFSLHLVAILGWLGLSLAELRSTGGFVVGFRLLVIAGTLGIVLHTPFAVDRRASSLGAGPLRSLLLAGATLVVGGAVGFFMCLPYMLD